MQRGCCVYLCCFVLISIVSSQFTVIESKHGTQVTPTCFVPKGRNTCGPHFAIIGSMKCGTTSLFTYLLNHPQMLPLKPDAKLNGRPILAEKEIRFFSSSNYNMALRKDGEDGVMDVYYDLFSDITPQQNEQYGYITGEATPMYVCEMGTAGRMKQAYEHGKLIWMMRNPVDRAYSDYWFRNMLTMRQDGNQMDERQSGFETCVESDIAILETCYVNSYLSNSTLEALKNLNDCNEMYTKGISRKNCDVYEYGDMCSFNRSLCHARGMIRNGLYYFQYLEWEQEFGAENILVIQSEEFYHNTASVMDRVTEFLGLETMDWSPYVDKAFNIVQPNTATAIHSSVSSGSRMGIGATDVANTSSYPPIDPKMRKLLEEFYAPYNQLLQSVLPQITWDY